MRTFRRANLLLAFAELLLSNPVAAQQTITPENNQATATAEQETKQGVEGSGYHNPIALY
jgi:hypothetical protein